MSGLLVAGTTSDAGKSVVTTALCRAFRRRGVRVAPFKAQNMSNNSMVCAGPDGSYAEIGRAQWIQAFAAGVNPEPAMNPVLLKPGSDDRSHVVVMGQPAGELVARDWVEGRRRLAATAHAAFDDLASRCDLVIAEGAGSPTEINLRSSDYVNMGLARHASLPTVVVGDIDRGGMFAAMFGTVALLEPADQALVAGFVVNKFRGDVELLQPGLEALQAATGRRIFGVLPWDDGLWLDSEDALELESRRASGGHSSRVVVIRLPRISNFTDADALGLERDLDVVFSADPGDLTDADLVVLPGTRATIGDLAWMRSRGLDRALAEHARQGKPLLGICGGCQMLGISINDPAAIEGAAAATDGLGLLGLTTEFTVRKHLGLPSGVWNGAAINGYEIHHGSISVTAAATEFPGGARNGNVYGTMWHGCFENDEFRRAFLTETLGHKPSAVSFTAAREARLERLADLAEQHLDLDAVLELARNGAPENLPVIAPGGIRSITRAPARQIPRVWRWESAELDVPASNTAPGTTNLRRPRKSLAMQLSQLGYTAMPWANGGGTTWEVARLPAAPATDFAWRISIAEIDRDGPFSMLPGVDRILTLASRATIELKLNGVPRQVPFATPVCFSGDDEVSCTVPEPVHALNVMTRRGSAAATVTVTAVNAAMELETGDAGTVMLVVLSGTAKLEDDGGARTLGPFEAATIAHGPLAVGGECTVAVVRIVERS